ncbi:hypothetical protein JL720_7334 [Aureococcus anophagefferens]|nr:hypothetical protein JL720_7334 [Aureococcus anophagefferens]
MKIPIMPKNTAKLKMPHHNPKQELFDLKKSWKDLPLSAVESEYNYVHHTRRMHAVMAARKGKGSVKAGAESPAKARPATRDGRATIDGLDEDDGEEVSATCKQILRNAYTLDDEQKEIDDKFTHMLADFDLYMMVNILEDALKDAAGNTGLEHDG